MKGLTSFKWIPLFLLIVTCLLVTEARRGGGGSRGGSRGSSSRGSSSRGSSSSSRGSSGNHYDRSRDRGAPAPAPRPPAPLPPPQTAAKPKMPAIPKQPAENPNFNQPPPYSSRERPPPYSPQAGQGAPPPYSPQGSNPSYNQPNIQPPPYSPQAGGIPGANYPRQPGMAQGGYPPQSGGMPQGGYPPQSGGIPGANYPRQPGMPQGGYPPQSGGMPQGGYPPQSGGIPGANYPRQPGISTGNLPHGSGYPNANYPKQPGMSPGVYPQGGGIQNANYPRQQYYPPNSLGSNVWHAQSGRPAPAYMNYGGLPTGANMETKSLKKKGLLGSLMSMGSHKPKKNKYYGSQPSPYAVGGYGAMGGSSFGSPMGGFMGKHGSKAAMYTILPYMAARTGSKLFRPRIGFMPLFLPSPFYHHHYYHYHNHGWGQDYRHIDVYNNDYVGKCSRPLNPEHGNVTCKSDYKQVECDVKCEEGYLHEDNTTSKDNKCWHVTGVWRPTKNFPACKPVCNETCLNGGTCIAPGVCGCPPEYRGPHCEFYFLNCDVRKLAGATKISWVCTHSKNETSCHVKCRPPNVFVTPPADLYRCTPDGTWKPDAIPHCVHPDVIANTTTEVPTTPQPESLVTITIAPET